MALPYAIPTTLRRCLGVHVDKDSAVSRLLRSNRDMEGESGFTGSALLTDHGAGFHVGVSFRWHVHLLTHLRADTQTCRRAFVSTRRHVDLRLIVSRLEGVRVRRR